MKAKRYFRWELLLAMGLVGCTSIVPNRLEPPRLATYPATGPNAGAALPGQGVRPQDDQRIQVHQGGTIVFQIRWPERVRTVQAIPDNAESIVVTVKSKAGETLSEKTATRPATGSAVSTLAFQLAPAIKKVDVFAVARDASGSLLVEGEARDVLIRDNTATGIRLTLRDKVAMLRVERQVALLHDVVNYFSRFENLRDMQGNPELKDLSEAFSNTFGKLQLDGPPRPPEPVPPPYDPNGEVKAAGYRIQSEELPISLHKPNDPSHYIDILGGELKKLHWPGHVASFTFDKSTARRSFELAIGAEGTSGDGTTAKLRAEAEAQGWVADPSLTTVADGLIDGNQATASLTFFGGERPEYVKFGKLSFELTPKGIATHSVGLALLADGFKDVSGAPLFGLIRDQQSRGANYGPFGVKVNPTDLQYWPTHARFAANASMASATADVTLNDDLLGSKLVSQLRARDRWGRMNDFNLEATGQLTLGTFDGKTDVDNAKTLFQFDDPQEQLRLKGWFKVTRQPQQVVVHADFIDIPSQEVIGTFDWAPPVQGGDMSRLESWPVLGIKGDSQPTYLTPGFFSGSKVGDVRVEVR